jgi:hypothetical protein
MRTGDDDVTVVSMSARPARFVFGPELRNDWQYELRGNRTQTMRRYKAH